MEYDKPFKTYDELIELMVSRNILVSDRSFAIGKNDLYSVVIIREILLNDPHLMENFIRDILFTFQPYLESKVQFCNKSILDVFSLPEDMFERLEAFTHNKYISSTR